MDTEHREGKVALIAVLGTSPAILTETIWGLYVDEKKRHLLPDIAIIYTTSTGQIKAEEMLRNKTNGLSIWEELEEAVGKQIRWDIRVFTDRRGDKLNDIVTSEDQDEVADQLLKGIREVKNPQQEVYHIVASVAGGRKSMSALMLGAMCLGGFPNDILTHVLVDEQSLDCCNDFFFPNQKKQELITRSGNIIHACDIKVDLAEIPFVALGSLLKNVDFELNGSYAKLVERTRKVVQNRSLEDIKICVSTSSYTVFINDKPIELKRLPYIIMAIMTEHALWYKDETKLPLLTAKRAYYAFNRLAKYKKLPDAIIKKIKEGEIATNSFFNIKAWKNEGESLYSVPDIARAKDLLKKALNEAGFSDVANDSIQSSRKKNGVEGYIGIGFNNIRNVSFIDNAPLPQPPDHANLQSDTTQTDHGTTEQRD